MTSGLGEPGDAAAPIPGAGARARFFFAIRPDAASARAIDAFAAREAPESRRLRLDHQHVTLALTEDYGPVPPGLVARLREAGEAVRGVPFDLTLDRLTVHRHALLLRPARPPAALGALQRAVVDVMAARGLPLRRDWHFDPHQTIAYRRKREQRDDGVAALRERAVAPILWRTEAFMLIRSLIGVGRHEEIGRWSLGGS